MATLTSIQGEIELSLSLLGKSDDPFQKDLEWFEYELAVETREQPAGAAAPTRSVQALERRSAKGKLSRKDFNQLLRSLEELVESCRPLRFEPYDLNFYFEWSRETPHVYLIVTWFDLGLSPRRLDQRFPATHAGFRFLADGHALREFLRTLEEEFLPAARPRKRRASTLVN